MNVLIEANKLCKEYTMGKNNRNLVLKEVDIRIEKGEFLCVMGPSGSGKSTLLYSLSGMDQISSGRVIFKGNDLASLNEKSLAALRLKEMGFIFQQIHLLKNLTLEDNILLSGFLKEKNKRREVRQRALRLMKMTGVEALAQKDITQASGGQLQRIGICRALINQPDIIFGDEPTGALDSVSSEEIMELLHAINNKGTTILLVTHDPRVAARSDRVLYMLDGQIKAEKKLGRYTGGEEESQEREEDLSRWLLAPQSETRESVGSPHV